MKVRTGKGQWLYIDTSASFVGGGAEGDVYTISDTVCAKILKNPKEKEEKILKMLSYKGLEKFASWPLDALYDGNGLFCGYTMPYIKSDWYLFSLTREDEKHDLFPDYTNIYGIRMMYNLAKIADVFHQNNIVIGDWNRLNWIVKSDGSIHRLDCDSLQFDKYRCEVCDSELSGPEQLSGNFTKESDSFSYAVILFMTLCETHPFGIDTDENAENPFLKNILNGKCFYMNEKQWPIGIINLREVYGEELFNLFRRCFDYNGIDYDLKKRPTMNEWEDALKPFISNNNFRHCPKCGEDYPKIHVSDCPYCKAQKAFEKAIPPVKTAAPKKEPASQNNTVTQKTVVKSNTGSGGGWFFVIVLLLLGIAGWYCYTHGFDVDVCLELMINCIGGIIGIVILIGVIVFLWPMFKGLFYILFIMLCLGVITTGAQLIIEVIEKLVG